MIPINKNSPPASLVTYKQQVGASFVAMDSGVNGDLRKSLFKEQGGICAYCERKINIEKSQIEHHCEQSICNGESSYEDRTLDYTNLLLVCRGNKHCIGERTCDTKKSEFAGTDKLPMKFNPLTDAHCSSISYSASGKIKSKHSDLNEELNTILNLNADHLKRSRKKIWTTLFREVGGNTHKLHSITAKMLNQGKPYQVDFPGLYRYLSP